LTFISIQKTLKSKRPFGRLMPWHGITDEICQKHTTRTKHTMRIITTQTEAYKFEELDEKAQEKVIQNLSHDWYDCIYEDAERIGLKITSFDLDRNRHATGKFFKSCEDVADLILKEHGESCDTYKLAKIFKKDIASLSLENEDDEIAEKLYERFEKDLLNEYAFMLQKEYEYLTSREAIIETINANEYEFTKEGKLV
jgi:hypothetical protein